MTLGWLRLLSLIGSLLYLVDVTHSNAQDQDVRKAYVVYMGDKPKIEESNIFHHHVNILREVVDDNKDITHEDLLLRSYKRSFHGFAAMLTEKEADKLAEMDDVLSVFPNKPITLHTTKSWNFLGFPETIKRNPQVESDIIVGMIDSGITPEAECFSDAGFGPPPKKWKGICQGNNNFTCNNKIIGARVYGQPIQPSSGASPRDSNGHGTHTASTVAGGVVKNVSVSGLGLGTARGGVPSARLAIYKIENVAGDADFIILLHAFDDAIADGVDIISASMGIPLGASDYFNDPFSIGSFHANQKGILVSMAVGNDGPQKKTLGNLAPWQLGVAASTINRQFITKIQLGNGKTYEALAVNKVGHEGKYYPLIYARDAAAEKPNDDGSANPNLPTPQESNDNGSANPNPSTPKSGFNMARFCPENSLDKDKVKGKIVLCDKKPKSTPKDESLAAMVVAQSGGIGIILTGARLAEEMAPIVMIPTAQVSLEENSIVYRYINSTSDPTATIWKSEEIEDVLAPYVPSFSSRGPNPLDPNILKPDLAAPGESIIAVVGMTKPDQKTALYQFMSGTSQACPHATAAAVYVKTFHPEWSPAAIRSALITTAKPMSDKSTPQAEFAYGAGLLNPARAPYPGLVYDLEPQDYVNYLCSKGYSEKQLQTISGDDSMSCSSNNDTVVELNYPSFALPMKDPESVNGVFHRTVSNVGSPNSKYKAKVDAPSGLEISVEPDELTFTSIGQKQSFVVTIKGSAKSRMNSASLVWDDGSVQVRSPIVVYAEI